MTTWWNTVTRISFLHFFSLLSFNNLNLLLFCNALNASYTLDIYLFVLSFSNIISSSVICFILKNAGFAWAILFFLSFNHLMNQQKIPWFLNMAENDFLFARFKLTFLLRLIFYFIWFNQIELIVQTTINMHYSSSNVFWCICSFML